MRASAPPFATRNTNGERSRRQMASTTCARPCYVTGKPNQVLVAAVNRQHTCHTLLTLSFNRKNACIRHQLQSGQ